MYLYVTYYIKNYLQYSIKTPKGIYTNVFVCNILYKKLSPIFNKDS